jgi:hypothetical protein
MLFWIVSGSLAILGVLAVIISQMPDSPIMKRKKEKKLPPPEPPKDWQGIAERAEKRVHNLESKLQEHERAFRDKDKEINEKKAVIAGLEQQFQQEQTWRKKEEDSVEKEKKREQLLEDELAKTRDGLNAELTQRIKQEYELKELRLSKESLGADARHLTGQNMELERKVKALTEENRGIKSENAVLKVKKEADQWVAKDDYVYVDKMLKRARWEVDQFKHKFPKEMWPKSILPKMEPVKPLAAQAAAPAEPAAPRPEAPAPAPAELAAPVDVVHPANHSASTELAPAAPAEPAVSGEAGSPAIQPAPVESSPEANVQPSATIPAQEPSKESAAPDTTQQQ